jgi:heme/copper-type cytochrome/quinol oxidase subunit 3
MAIRTYESTKGEIWEWEETPESVKALEIYWHIVDQNQKQNENEKV